MMKKTEFTGTQILSMLHQQEEGLSVDDICREQGISAATFYNWKAEYSRINPSHLKQLKELEEENARLKKIHADLSLIHHILKDVLEKRL